MTFYVWWLLATVLACTSTLLSFSNASPLFARDISLNPAGKLLGRAAPADPDDQSWIKNWAAVGDSYSAGIGAGTRLGGWGDYFCSRYNTSFPALINSDARLGDPSGRTFTFWACSGAKTADITKQVSALKGGTQDVITITSGGNDAYLADILNECVFGWAASSTPTWSACPPVLDKAQKKIDDPGFHSSLDKLIATAKSKLNANGKVYYVGYAQFWGDEDKQCNDITWQFTVNYGKRQYLTQDRRQRMNELVRNMNAALSAAVKRAGDQVVFVDYDKDYRQTVSGFCENGVVEPSPNRAGLLLYEYYTDDNVTPNSIQGVNDTQPLARPGGLVMNGTFEGQINEWMRESLAANSSLVKQVLEAPISANQVSIKAINATDEQLVTGYSSYLIPDSYGRVFHPRPAGHMLISNLVLYYMAAEQAKRLKTPVPVEAVTSDTCPAHAASKPSPTTHSTPPSRTPTPTKACQGNQVAGNCVGASLPSATPYSGPQMAVCDKVDSGAGSQLLRINDTQAQQAATKYCGALASQKVVLDGTGSNPKPYIVTGAAEKGGDLSVTVLYDVNWCPKDKSMTKLDFTKLSAEECFSDFYTMISNTCLQDSTWGKGFDPNHSLEGGVYGGDCGVWALTGQPTAQ